MREQVLIWLKIVSGSDEKSTIDETLVSSIVVIV